ncbi:MAG TPA: flippase [Puia sp.]|nr:flippase [Puia sp.]
MYASNRLYWLKSGSYTLMTNLQTLLFGFGSFYLLVRMLDKTNFGIWVLFVATTTIFETARNGMIQNGLIRFLSNSTEGEYREILSASFFLSGALMIICIIVNFSIAGYLADLWHYHGLALMFYIYNLVYVLQGILAHLQWIEQANLSFRGILVTNGIRQGGFFIFVLICFVFHFHVDLIFLIYAQMACAIIGSAIQYIFVKKQLIFSRHINFAYVKKLFGYGKFVFGTSISAILTATLNQMMLGALLSSAAAGAFNIAVRILNLAAIPSNVAGTIVFPQSARRFVSEGHRAIKYLYEKSVGAILAILVPCLLFLFLFPGFVVHVVAGSNYPETIPVVRLIVITCLATPFARQFGTILDSMGKPRINFIIILISVTIELVLVYFLVRRYGIIGAVYATLIADALTTLAMQIILRKELNVNILNTFVYAAKFYPELFNKYVRPALGMEDRAEASKD